MECTINACLLRKLDVLFSKGPETAAARYHVLEHYLKGVYTQTLQLPDPETLRIRLALILHNKGLLHETVQKYPWEGCKLAASLVALLCTNMSHQEALWQALKFQSRFMGGLPTMAEVAAKPSASLASQLRAAIDRVTSSTSGTNSSTSTTGANASSAATGETLDATGAAASGICIIVTLVDKVMLKAGEEGNIAAAKFNTYAHTFSLLVEPQGVGLYQAWGKGGYTLQVGAGITREPLPPKLTLFYLKRIEGCHYDVDRRCSVFSAKLCKQRARQKVH
jgi:hypothetical protein